MAQRSSRGFRARVAPSSAAMTRRAKEVGQVLARVSARAHDCGIQLSNWVASTARAVSAPAPVAVRRAAYEALESRQLLSSASFSAGTLTLVGDPGANNISVDLVGGGIAANANGKGVSAPLSAVRRINITGGAGNDFIYINAAIHVPASVNTFGGNDMIKGGGGIDTIAAGDGNDTIYGSGSIDAGNGIDQVHVGNFASTLTLGSGNDTVYGGPGGDTVVAIGGNDDIYGGSGNDSITATGGNQYVDGGAGNDTITTGTGNDTLVGGPGSDHLNAGTGTNSYKDLTAADFAPAGVVRTVGSPVPTPAQGPGGTGLSQGGTYVEDRTVNGTNHGISLAPTPVVNVRGITGMAEQSVFVDAVSSNLAVGTPLTAAYRWDFGDSGSAYNVLTGWNAGHIYNNPGTYTITLTLTNQLGYTSSLSTQVTVTASTRRTIYVDAVAGNDSNPGTSPAQPLRTPAAAQSLLGSNTTVLFHRGQTFTFDRTFNVNYREVVVGAYGSGAAPVMKKVPGAANSGIGIFWTGGAADQVVFENMTFDSVYTPVGNAANHIPAVGVFAGGRNITVRNNTFLNIDDAVNSYSGPTGVLVENNTCPLPTGLRGYLDYVNGTDSVILGNTVVNTTREHIIRSTDDTTQRLLIAGNNLDNSYSRQGIDPPDFPKCTINIRAGHYVYITDNQLSDGMAGFGPGPWTPATDACEWLVLDGNRFHNAQLYLAGNVHHAVARNNLFDIQDTAQIQIRPLDPDYSTRTMSDVTITNNTGVSSSTKGTFLELDGGSPRGIITVTNNVFSAPNFQPGLGFAAPIYVRAPDLSAFRLFDHNVWPSPTSLNRYKLGGVNYVAVGLDMLKYLTSQEWNGLANVGTDQFLRTTLGGNSLQTWSGGTLVGAVLPSALR